SWTRRCCPHFLQTVEKAPTGSNCWWLQWGQVSRTFCCLLAGIQWQRRKTTGNGSAENGLGGSGGGLRGFAGTSGRRGGGNLVRIHFRFADERHAFLNRQLRGADVAEQFGLRFDVDLFLCVDIAGDLAAHYHGLGVNIAVDDGAVAEVQSAVRL